MWKKGRLPGQRHILLPKRKNYNFCDSSRRYLEAADKRSNDDGKNPSPSSLTLSFIAVVTNSCYASSLSWCDCKFRWPSVFRCVLFSLSNVGSYWRNVFLQKPGIILLKEGTDSSQGIPQLISNINACQYIADAVRTTLGPRGMDKLIVDAGGNTTRKITLSMCLLYVKNILFLFQVKLQFPMMGRRLLTC